MLTHQVQILLGSHVLQLEIPEENRVVVVSCVVRSEIRESRVVRSEIREGRRGGPPRPIEGAPD